MVHRRSASGFVDFLIENILESTYNAKNKKIYQLKNVRSGNT
jgi:hypothetical protein